MGDLYENLVNVQVVQQFCFKIGDCLEDVVESAKLLKLVNCTLRVGVLVEPTSSDTLVHGLEKELAVGRLHFSLKFI